MLFKIKKIEDFIESSGKVYNELSDRVENFHEFQTY